MGSKSAWAIDTDDWSIENARENFQTKIYKRLAPKKKEGFETDEQFDVILANINKNVILGES